MKNNSKNTYFLKTIANNIPNYLFRAMLSVVVTVVCIVCYCCHRSIRKRTEAAYRQRWMENDANMEIYSVEQVNFLKIRIFINQI